MSIPAAYLGVIVIWATTPLAIKWSGEGVGFLFGVSARMAFGLMLCLVLVGLLRIEFPWDRRARRTYLAGGLGVYGAMLLTYWGAQFIPSGLVSVIFGLTPFVTGLLAVYWLTESPTAPRLAGMALGFAGLGLVFQPAFSGQIAWQGVVAVVAAVVFHSASMVAVKRIAAPLHPMAANTGALSIAVPLYLLTWLSFDGRWPEAFPERAGWAIGYLAVLGTVVGFNLYYYALKHSSPASLSLIALITPVLALLIGQTLNGERPDGVVWAGTACILLGLGWYQLGGWIVRRLRQ